MSEVAVAQRASIEERFDAFVAARGDQRVVEHLFRELAGN